MFKAKLGYQYRVAIIEALKELYAIETGMLFEAADALLYPQE